MFFSVCKLLQIESTNFNFSVFKCAKARYMFNCLYFLSNRMKPPLSVPLKEADI